MSNKIQKVDCGCSLVTLVGIEMSIDCYTGQSDMWFDMENLLEAYADDATMLALVSIRQ